MRLLRTLSRHARRPARFWVLPAVLFACGALFSSAFAACLPSLNPEIHRLQVLVNQDAKATLAQVQKLLDRERLTEHPDARRFAALYDVQAQAFSILELEGDAREAVSTGLNYATGDTDPIRLDLLATLAENVYDQAEIDAADKLIERAHKLQARGSLADTCLLIGRGLLQFREGRDDLAIGSLTQAYNDSKGPQFIEPHVLAASSLSTVLRGMGDYQQALALNQEAVEWDLREKLPLSLGVDRFLRGRILTLMGRNEEAIDQYMDSRRLSEQFNDTQGLGYVDVRVCEARVELKQLDRARADCENARRIFKASVYVDQAKDAQALLARIDLAEGHPEKALAALNAVLDKNGADLQPRRVASIFEWRARTNAALHDYRAAYADLEEYLSRATASDASDHNRQAAALRARFETDREIERNERLNLELDESRLRTERQAQQLRWNAIAAVSALIVIALLAYFLISNLRYRKQLVRLASLDGLTGLANRRRTAELANLALSHARHEGTQLAIALIDMDHFKFINDRCGHATGDLVLKSFARVSRESLRDGDVLGRWGGEEFLLVMPGATLEVALATLERLRTLTFGIVLPLAAGGMRVSVSAGIALYDRPVRSLDELIARADLALYAAKNEGRDQVRIADENFVTSSGIRRATRE